MSKDYRFYSKCFLIILLFTVLYACNGIVPTSPVINSFTADVTTIIEGDSATLSWQVTDATGISISPTVGDVSSTPTGTSTVSPTSTTNYTLTATNSVGSTIATVSITVNEEPVKLLVNGDFSTCDFTGWTVTESNDFPKFLITIPTGCAAWMGDGADELYDGDTNMASIQQMADIPLGAVNPTLILLYQVKDTDKGGEGYDWMKIYINGLEVLQIWEDSSGWQEFQYDLSSYAGTSIVLKISAWTLDNKSAVFYYVDDISISWD